MRPHDNSLLSGTSGYEAWRGPGNGRVAECDSGTLSGTTVDEERDEGAGTAQARCHPRFQSADLNVGQLLTIPDGLLHSGKVNMYPCSPQTTW
jgi:hypothetical protein